MNTKKLLLFIPASIYMGALIYFARKAPRVMIKFKLNDSIIHFLAYGMMAFLLYIPIKYNFKTRYKFILSLIITIGFAFLDEINQKRIKTRTFDYKDILFDFLGALSILVIIKIVEKFYKNN